MGFSIKKTANGMVDDLSQFLVGSNTVVFFTYWQFIERWIHATGTLVSFPGWYILGRWRLRSREEKGVLSPPRAARLGLVNLLQVGALTERVNRSSIQVWNNPPDSMIFEQIPQILAQS